MIEGRTHYPVIRSQQCHRCDICLRGCPADLISEYRREEDSLRGILYRGKVEKKSLKNNISVPPCQEACPIHQDTRSCLALISKGRFKEALELIREVNPLPAVCGYICHHPCEEACLREGVDHPVPIRLLKRFVAEYGREKKIKRRPLRKRHKKILVVGSGPAGLAAAYSLSLHGFGVTILEALPVLGGMLSVGIPEYRLPRDILKMEINGIKALGVEMVTDHPFFLKGDGRSFERLGYYAVFFSIGAHRSLKLNIPGRTLKGVLPGVEFLRGLNLGRRTNIGREVAVIGGGNVAVDAARSAQRLGAERVEIYYRRSKREMPAIPEEVEEAIREGVKIKFLASPTRILGRGGKVVGLECIRMRLGEPDEIGRRRPVPIEDSHFKVYADTIISAIGQRVDRKALNGLEVNRDGTVRTNPETGETSMKGVFAGGDVVTGPGWAVDAIASGKKGAESIRRYLS